LKQFLNDSINERLKSALGTNNKSTLSEVNNKYDQVDVKNDSPEPEIKVLATDKELDGFNIIRAILRKKVGVERIVARDTQSYFGVLLDDNNRKPICRLHFNAKQKYIGIFNDTKQETRHRIEKTDGMFIHMYALMNTIAIHE